jgi:Na+/proline symporter
MRISLVPKSLRWVEGLTAGFLGATFVLVAFNWAPIMQAYSRYRDVDGFHPGHAFTGDLGGWAGTAAATYFVSLAASKIWSDYYASETEAAERQRISLLFLRFLLVFFCFCSAAATIYAARQ